VLPKVAEVVVDPLLKPPESAIPFGLASIEPMYWIPVPLDALAHCHAPEPSIFAMNALVSEDPEVVECESKFAVPANSPPT
jgi:hypothetical protein